MIRLPVPVLALVAAALLLSACGTTVQQPAGSPAAGGVTTTSDGLGAGLPAAQLPGAASGGAANAPAAVGTGTQSGSVAAGAGQAPVAAGSGKVSTSVGGTQAGGAASAVPATGRGWDRNFVYVGVATQKDVQQAFETVGVSGLNAGDQEGVARAVADELNRRGGLFGRKISIVFRDHKTIATAQDPSGTAQATCTYFTQDRPVVAFLNPVTLMDGAPLRSCFAKARVPLFSASVASLDTKATQLYAPYLYASVAPVWDPFTPVLMSRLKAQGYFGGWDATNGVKVPGTAKVGILIKSDEISGRISAMIARAVAAAGAPAPEVYSFKDGSEMQSAVLQFRGRGVTHVISTDGGALLGFMLAAEDQTYRPRYGISSFLTPGVLLQGTAPARQLVGMTGVGWSPSVDVTDANDPGATGPGETECAAIFNKAGQSFTGKRLAEAVAYAFCDGLRLTVAAALDGGGLTGPQIALGMRRAGPALSSAFGFGNGLGPGRYFLPGAVRDVAYVDSCSCFRYLSRTNFGL